MKKIGVISFFILIFLLGTSYKAYANEKYISVLISKYKNTNNISIGNKNINIGKNENNIFYNGAEISTNKNFSVKPINMYSIKCKDRFYDYNEALNFSKGFNDSYIYKDDMYYVMLGSFTNMIEANNYLSSNNINGDITKIENSIGIYEDNMLLIVHKDNMAIKSSDSILIDNKQYRNFINITCKNNILTVINILDIEEYLYGVVPAEMPASWHKEALKAQAVACRNYAYANLGNHKNEGFDICDTVHCQVYNGLSNEKESTSQAVDETKGIFAYYDNELINAVYSSSSGGYTDDAENVWNNSVPYLKSVKDEYEEGAKQWTRTFTFDELSSIANIGVINEVILENSSITGRATSLTLVGTTGEKVLKKEEIRTFFSKSSDGSLESRNFKMAQSNLYSNNQKSNKNNNNDYYGVSSTGNNIINKNSYFTMDKNGNIQKAKNIVVIDKNQNIQTLSNDNINNNTENINYASKVTRQDSNSLTFIGKGWGHGVGMSQYGANSLAKKGYKYDEILKYYYTGINVR